MFRLSGLASIWTCCCSAATCDTSAPRAPPSSGRRSCTPSGCTLSADAFFVVSFADRRAGKEGGHHKPSAAWTSEDARHTAQGGRAEIYKGGG
eukprot:scaffold3853_cov118-Isochrysis_galbana.AAC.6